jgi:hypothetical protein
MMARRKLSGLDCSKLFYLPDLQTTFIVTEESKIEMLDQGDAKTQFQKLGRTTIAPAVRHYFLRLLLAKQLVEELV